MMSLSRAKLGGVYRINLSPTHFYVGRTSDLSRRAQTHLRLLRQGKHENGYMQRVFNQYLQFEWEVLLPCAGTEDAVKAEQILLNSLFRTDGCVNLSQNAVYGPGMTGKRHTEATKKLIREARAHQTFSEETRQKMSRASKGHQRTKGHKYPKKSDELRRMMSEAQKGRPLTDAHRQALSQAWASRPPVTDETRRKLSAARKTYWDRVRLGQVVRGSGMPCSEPDGCNAV